ncbi:MAG: branched-chain amino acid ABC transporter permease [Rhizobiaceae bacterium]|nr:branched-chain amino acid ABC transporter permease [Rhizobiaceae bacterium]
MLYIQLLVDGLVTGCAVGLVALSFSYFYATTGIFHVAHAGIYTLSGYIALHFVKLGLPFVAALAIAIAVAAGVGAFIQVTLYARLEKRGASPLVKMIASIGVLTVLQNIVALTFTPNILQFDLPWRISLVHVFGIGLSIPQLILLIVSPLILFAMLAFSRWTPLGKRIRAVASNPELAETTQLHPERIFIYVIAIASGLVAVPAVLVGVDQAMQPYTSLLVLLTAIIAMIAGGIGSMGGAFVMSILLAVIQSVSVMLVSGRWSIALVFAVFIVFILWRPEGLFRRNFNRQI